MKNLVMGVATGYDWYTLEPFVNSFKRYCKNADLVLFVDNISEFTDAKLQKENVKLDPVPAEFKSAPIIDVRWIMYKNFLDEHGKDYRQVFLTDTRDVIFQGNPFEPYINFQNYFGYVTSESDIKNSGSNFNNNWLTNLIGKAKAKKLGNKKFIGGGTIQGTINEVKIFCENMVETSKRSTRRGDEQSSMNYLVYDNLLPIENLMEIDCTGGSVFTVRISSIADHSVKVENEKILRGDGGVPAVIHQYDRHPELVQLVDKFYRSKDFQFDETFADTRSLLEQILCLIKIGKIIDTYKIFTKYLFGNNLSGYGNILIKLWEDILKYEPNPVTELLALSIQSSIPAAFDGELSWEQINRICSATDFSIQIRLAVNFNFKIFLGNILYQLSNDLYNDSAQLSKCVDYLDMIKKLEIPAEKDFYLFQSKVYLRAGRKSESLTAYRKALYA